MTSRAEALRAKARGIQRHQQADAAEDEQPARQRVATERSKPVRRSVDLSPTQHSQLAAWCSATAVELGASRITGRDVFVALVDRLLSDPDLARQIRADLRDQMRDA